MPEKVILDTDIGSDIDDAVALAYLLANPDCDLLGVTTVSGQAVERAKLASALCMAAGRDVPVFPGVEEPLKAVQRQPLARQSAVLDRWPHRKTFPQGGPNTFIAETVRHDPGEITLLSIGPMTNIARLFVEYPDTALLLKSLVIMGGRFGPAPRGRGTEEWNVLCDPHAAAIAYSAPVNLHRSVGLDVTMKLQMPAADVRRRFQTGLLRPVLDMAEVYFSDEKVITFHDPLAAVCIFHPEVCKFEKGRAVVKAEPNDEGRFMNWRPDARGPHEAAVAVDPARFFERYFRVFE
ncbi:MAG: nucleoside hydrolase [Dehalococcoidia bacterium]|nr:nucleoside hydrolase [Dehalococcoidia bacterium]